MENRSYALMTGFFTVALLVAAVLVGLWLNRDRTSHIPYEIVTTQTIPGLNPQAAVRYRGLEVGRVDDILFDPRVTGQILIKLSIDEDAPGAATTVRSHGRLADNLQAPGGPSERAGNASASLEGVPPDLELQTLPHVFQTTDDASTSLRAVRRAVTGLGERPQSITFGAPTAK